MELKKIRWKKGMTQEELAFWCGVCRESISRYEHGSYPRDMAVIERIADALDVTGDQVVEGIMEARRANE